MYTATLDGALFMDPRVDSRQVLNPKLSLEVNKAGSFTFTIPQSHPLYSAINKLKSIVEVYQDGVRLFRGRPLEETTDLWNQKQVTCEGELAFLNDSIVRPYSHSGPIADYLGMILTEHNSQVDAAKQIALGNVTVTDPNDKIVRSNVAHVSAWQEINAKLLSLLGGYLVTRRTGGVTYLDYLADSEYLSTQTIELGKNLLDVVQSQRGADLITALIPAGAKLTDANGQQTDERLTIASENGGLDYISNATAVEQYGWIFGTQTWDDVTIASNLLTKATQELAIRSALGSAIEVKAVDLSMLDADVDQIRLFEYLRVTSPAHGIDSLALVTKQEIDLANPANNAVTFGFFGSSLTQRELETSAKVNEILSDYVINDQIRAVEDSLITVSSAITQTAGDIRTEVREDFVANYTFDQYKESVSTQFIQTSSDFTFKFTDLLESIENLGGDTRTRFSEIEKYIRFVDGQILLGETGSEITLTISNNRISFKQNNAEVAYISDNKLYIVNGQFVSSIRVGDYAFTLRSNGSLSLGKVK